MLPRLRLFAKQEKAIKKTVIKDALDTNVPGGVMNLILAYSELSSQPLFQPALANSFNDMLTKLATNELLNHVKNNDLIKAEAMIKANPALLLEKGVVVSGDHPFCGTALQLALAADNFFGTQEMLQMIERHLLAMPNGEKYLIQQLKQQFPLTWKEDEKQHKQSDIDALQRVAKAINDSKDIDACKQAVNQFKFYIQKNKISATGKHYHNEMLIEAYKLYGEYFASLGGFGSEKNKLFYQEVIGLIQTWISPSARAAFAAGYCRSIEINGDSSELTMFRPSKAEKLLHKNPIFHLGYHAWNVEKNLENTTLWNKANTWTFLKKLCRNEAKVLDQYLTKFASPFGQLKQVLPKLDFGHF